MCEPDLGACALSVCVCWLRVCSRGEIQRRSACYDRVTSETGQKQLVMEGKGTHAHRATDTHPHTCST